MRPYATMRWARASDRITTLSQWPTHVVTAVLELLRIATNASVESSNGVGRNRGGGTVQRMVRCKESAGNWTLYAVHLHAVHDAEDHAETSLQYLPGSLDAFYYTWTALAALRSYIETVCRGNTQLLFVLV